MELSSPTVEADVNRLEIAERISRASTPKISATAHRHLLARGLRRFADRLEN